MALQIQNTGLVDVVVSGLNNLNIAPSATVSGVVYSHYTKAQIVSAITPHPTLTLITVIGGDFQINNNDAVNAVTVVDLQNLVVPPATPVAVPLSLVPLTEAQVLDAIRPFPELVLLGATSLSVDIPTQPFDILNPAKLSEVLEDFNIVDETHKASIDKCLLKNGYNDTFVTAGGKTVTVVDGQIVSII